jgi:MFS family permease
LGDASWYGTVYLFAGTALQPIWGKALQLFEVKRTFLFILALFSTGSLLSAIAPNSSVFIIGRALSGIGACGEFTAGFTILAYIIPLRSRPMFSAAAGGIYGVALLLNGRD